MQGMQTALRTRRLIALIAAYVVAIQALLLPLTVAASASLDASLCISSVSGDGSGSTTGHKTGGLCAANCAMQCCAPAFASPPRIELAFGATGAGTAAEPSVIVGVLIATTHTPQSARAPPGA